MPRSRHDRVVEILYNLAKKIYEISYAYNISEYETIDIITKSHKRRAAITYPYSPDLWCKDKRTGRIDVYEVWDKQLPDACVGDIVLSALTPNIDTLSIICFDKKQEELAHKLAEVILYSLFDDKRQFLLNPNLVKPYITLIPKDIQNNVVKIEDYLREKLKLH